MIISGAGMRAPATARAVTRDVRSMRGRIAALSAAVRVRARKPYCVETSAPLVAASPRARAAATSAPSRSGRSTANASLTATRLDARRAQRRRARRGYARRATPARNERPSASANGANRANARETGPPSVTTPTLATSPSSSAFVACVVECAMNAIDSGSIACSPSSRSSPATIPAATPSAMIVRRRHLDRRHHLARGSIDRDDVGERATDVDPDAKPRRGTQPSNSSTEKTTSGNAVNATLASRPATGRDP